MRNNKGFTLIELVMVIVILGILAAVAIPRFANLSDNATKSTLQGAVGAFKSGVVSYLGLNSEYPAIATITANPDTVLSSDDFTIQAAAGTGDEYGDVASPDLYLVDVSSGDCVGVLYDPTSGKVTGPTDWAKN